MREIVPQTDQRDDRPVDEHRPIPRTGPRLTFPGTAGRRVTVPPPAHGPANASAKQARCRWAIPVNNWCARAPRSTMTTTNWTVPPSRDHSSTTITHRLVIRPGLKTGSLLRYRQDWLGPAPCSPRCGAPGETLRFTTAGPRPPSSGYVAPPAGRSPPRPPVIRGPALSARARGRRTGDKRAHRSVRQAASCICHRRRSNSTSSAPCGRPAQHPLPPGRGR